MSVVSTTMASELQAADRTKNYNGIDLVKVICSLLVFIIHITPFRTDSFAAAEYVNYGLQHYLARLAVPFFFVSSGFFLFRKTGLYGLDTNLLKKYCFKMIRLIGIWSILLFVGGIQHLWYLKETVIAVVLLFGCLRFQIKIKYLYLLAVFLYFIGLLGDSYYGLIEPLTNIPLIDYAIKGYRLFFQTTRNGLFMGFIFVLMGAAFAHFEIKMHLKTALLGFTVSMICLFAEVFLLRHYQIPYDYNMYIFLLPAVFFLFQCACGIKIKDSPIFKQLRLVGVLSYFLHLFGYRIVTFGIIFIRKCFDIDFSQYEFILSLLLTYSLSVLLTWLSGKNSFRWLRFLYT